MTLDPSLLASSDARATARTALEMVHANPARAWALASEALGTARDEGDRLTEATALRALGLAARERHDIETALVHLRLAVRVAEGAGLATSAAEARMSLVGALALGGEWSKAKREADRAAAVLRGAQLARLETQRAHLCIEQGRLDEALLGFRRALPVLRRSGDRLGEAFALDARGVAHFYRGELPAAEADLRRAAGLYVAVGEDRRAATNLQSLGVVVALRGDLPEALACFDRADEYLREHDQSDAMGLVDRSEALLAARLVSEARESAARAVDALAKEGRKGYLAHAHLKLAEATLVEGDLATARARADEARREFLRQRRPSWAALALHVSMRAAFLAGERSPRLLARARATAAALDDAGFKVPALDARLVAAQVALGLGRTEVARKELAVASRLRRRGPVQLRARAWHAEALLRLAAGNRRGASAALLAGINSLDAYRAALGPTELRARASGHVAELARLGERMALEDHDADRVLMWSERGRAGAMRVRPARPPKDATLAAHLTELRAAASEADAAALAGRPSGRLLARQAALEEKVRSRARHATGVLAASLAPIPAPAALAETLGSRALVETVEHGGVLSAVVLVDGRSSIHELAPRAEVEAEVEALRFSLRRLAHGRGPGAALAAAADASAFGARRLDELTLQRLAPAIGEREVVLVPTGSLHALPWAALPSFAGRVVTVAPSAAVWYRAATASTFPMGRGGRVVLAAGPGLPHAAAEVRALSRRYPAALRFSGAAAMCPAVTSALDGARLAHIAAHGRFRADNPMFSSLQLADGPLTVYDLERLSEPPGIIVLSACDSGLSEVHPGDELMGLAAALLALGTRTLVASVFPVPDEATRPLMLRFHAALRAGLTPAAALARAQQRSARGGHAAVAAAAAFVCFGAGG